MITVESELRTLSEAASRDIVAPADLAGRVLRRARTGRRRRVAGISAVAVAALAGSLGAARLGSGPYFNEVQPSYAMDPTIRSGDVVTFNRDLTPGPGDVVRLELPTTGMSSISRIIATGGHTVGCPPEPDGTCAGVQVDGVRQADPYLAALVTAPFDEVTIPTGQVFVLGDNRSVAMDSRILGPVGAGTVEAVAVAVEHHGRLERLPGAPRHQAPGDSDPVDPPGQLPASRTNG